MDIDVAALGAWSRWIPQEQRVERIMQKAFENGDQLFMDSSVFRRLVIVQLHLAQDCKMRRANRGEEEEDLRYTVRDALDVLLSAAFEHLLGHALWPVIVDGSVRHLSGILELSREQIDSDSIAGEIKHQQKRWRRNVVNDLCIATVLELLCTRGDLASFLEMRGFEFD